MNAPQWDLSIAYSGIDDPKISADIALVHERLAELVQWRHTPADCAILRQALSQAELARITACNLAEYTGCLLARCSMSQPDDMFWASKLHFSIAEVSFYKYPYLFGYLFSKGVYAQREQRGLTLCHDATLPRA